MIPYNYNMLKDDIKENVSKLSYYDLCRIDHVNIHSMDKPGKIIYGCLAKAQKKYRDGNPDCKKYMFKEIVSQDALNNFILFTISDYNKRELNRGLDRRSITISEYSMDGKIATLRYTFKCKIDHLYQLYDDLSLRIQYTSTFKACLYNASVPKFNLYVLPIYVSIDGGDYIRISDTEDLDPREVVHMMSRLYIDIGLFLALNTLIFDTTETNKIYSYDTYRKHIARGTIDGDEDKYSEKRIRYSNNKSSIKYIEYEGEYVPIVLREEQVRGHYKYVWFGSKKDNTRHKERIWIEPYIRGTNKNSRTVKSYS